MSDALKPLIAKVADANSLSADEAEAAFTIIMSGDATEAQIGAFLMALRVRGETVDEITGAVRTMRAKALAVNAPVGAIDVVGTGGDGSGTYNISTAAAIREMVLPGLLAILSPVVVGFVFGPETLGGLLAGVTVAGVLMAIFQSNAGGAWDNAKKMFEEGDGLDIGGKKYGKGSDPHKAAVVGDTVGDPFKDTSGPSLNILIKLMSVVSLVIAPLIAL